MFCSNCGSSVGKGSAFCGNCGNSIPQKSNKPLVGIKDIQSLKVKHSSFKLLIVLTGFILLVTVVLVIINASGGGIRGTWIVEHSHEDFPATVEFRRGSFTASTYIAITPVIVGGGLASTHPLSHTPWNWGLYDRDVGREFIGVSGNSDVFSVIYHGTFSITDDQIEMIFTDGTIEVFHFLQTDNTLTIGRVGGSSQTRLIRK